MLSKGEIPSKKVKVEFSLEGMDTDGFKDGATYDEIRERTELLNERITISLSLKIANSREQLRKRRRLSLRL
ncbi:hypothetical protein [Butyrivibrio sp. MC2021]|uniref:hypothetical protein n=1 Tax=Butyrivibrio sp. MC2021 TaxID=1408306 RepID=UPI00047AC6D4|nr:hypothetical protein [Butyrivibrio sp. MC2021]